VRFRDDIVNSVTKDWFALLLAPSNSQSNGACVIEVGEGDIVCETRQFASGGGDPFIAVLTDWQRSIQVMVNATD
jgi:hypothetical protein